MGTAWKVINHTTWKARFDEMIRRDGNRMTPSLVRQVAEAADWSGADYQRAMFQRADLFRMVQGWFEKADFLVTPTVSRTALPIDQDLFDPITIDGIEAGELRRNWFPYTMPFNITGHPALSRLQRLRLRGPADQPADRRPLPRRGLGAAGGGALRGERELARPMAGPLRRRPPPLTAEQIQARVLHRDGLILVIDKPAGLAVHAGPSGAPNLEECFDDLRYGLPRPPALAHRLDADTAGVLVLGRHPKALAKLGRLFSGRDTEKTYWAVVEGEPPADEGVFDMPLLKVNTRSGWSVKVSDKGQPSVTRYKVMGRAPGMTWLELKPETGRTHQIRVHCAAAGCPVIADRLYGRAEPNNQLHLQSHGIVLPLSKSKPPIVRHRPAACSTCWRR